MDNIELVGSVEEIVYTNYENGYTVCTLDCSGEMVTATGYMPYISEGENIKVFGIWKKHPEYGEQLNVTMYEKMPIAGASAILRYLASGIIKGVRLSTAKKIVDTFGDDTITVLNTCPERLSEIKGISPAKATEIAVEYARQQSLQHSVMFLQEYGISASMALKIHRQYGSDTVEYIKSNPYILVDDINGISFHTADKIAFKMGLDPNNKERIMTGIKYILMQSAYSAGHTYLPEEELVSSAVRFLGADIVPVENSITALCAKKDVKTEIVDGRVCAFLSEFLYAEQNIARRINYMIKDKPIYNSAKAQKLTDKWEKDNNFELAPEQKHAVISALSNKVMIITGGPGTGKTTIVNSIIHILKNDGYKVALAAPTGRAAKRISEVTGEKAKTIHRLLEFEFSYDDSEQKFSKDEFSPLDKDLIIVDEASMLDVSLASSLLAAMKTGAGIIFVGDSDQLPPVGAGNMLSDIIESGRIPVCRLTKIFRQAAKSLIIQNAHKIVNGAEPILDDKSSDFFFMSIPDAISAADTICDLYEMRLPKAYGYDFKKQIQVLSPMRKGILGVNNLNKLLQARVNPRTKFKAEIKHGEFIFREGDKVMQIKNNYDLTWNSIEDSSSGSGVFNGDIGFISKINRETHAVTVIFDDTRKIVYNFDNLNELELAYAVTVHKSQGNEFDAVIMPAYHCAPMLMKRNLLYTAVTRAKKIVVLVGKKSAVSAMVASESTQTRYTSLKYRL